jgi:hypothetical protein
MTKDKQNPKSLHNTKVQFKNNQATNDLQENHEQSKSQVVQHQPPHIGKKQQQQFLYLTQQIQNANIRNQTHNATTQSSLQT